jgi:predicted DNA repair protein MutK
MSSGLLALLDDVAAIAKVAAASVDDLAGLAAKAGAKSAGVVIDDAAVTPRYVVGFAAQRELPIVLKIAVGSLKNKLLFLLPGALALSVAAPWAITPLLMLGGLFLCHEGAEKVIEAIFPHAHHGTGDPAAHSVSTPPSPQLGTPEGLEQERIASAIKTDFILSAEIMAIALGSAPEASFWQQAGVLGVVGVGITVLVYGAVAVIVKADDVGFAMAARETSSAIGRLSQALGRSIVRVMPGLLTALSGVGAVAMLLVGGGILLHGLEVMGVVGPAHLLHDLDAGAGALIPAVSGPALSGLVGWTAASLATTIAGFLVGLALIPVVARALRPAWALASRLRRG